MVLEDRKSVAAFLAARFEAARALPSRETLHELVVAVQIGHRRSQRALSLVFEGTEDAQLKRSILKRYSILDRSLDHVQSSFESMPTPDFLAMAQSVIEVIDGGFQFASSHIDDIRNTQPEVGDEVDTRPTKSRDPADASPPPPALEGEEPSDPSAELLGETTRRGH